jgi:hypothetical protein
VGTTFSGMGFSGRCGTQNNIEYFKNRFRSCVLVRVTQLQAPLPVNVLVKPTLLTEMSFPARVQVVSEGDVQQQLVTLVDAETVAVLLGEHTLTLRDTEAGSRGRIGMQSHFDVERAERLRFEGRVSLPMRGGVHPTEPLLVALVDFTEFRGNGSGIAVLHRDRVKPLATVQAPQGHSPRTLCVDPVRGEYVLVVSEPSLTRYDLRIVKDGSGSITSCELVARAQVNLPSGGAVIDINSRGVAALQMVDGSVLVYDARNIAAGPTRVIPSLVVGSGAKHMAWSPTGRLLCVASRFLAVFYSMEEPQAPFASISLPEEAGAIFFSSRSDAHLLVITEAPKALGACICIAVPVGRIIWRQEGAVRMGAATIDKFSRSPLAPDLFATACFVGFGCFEDAMHEVIYEDEQPVK